MPIYEYQCQNCSAVLEAFQGIKDHSLIECPQCHQSSLKRIVSAAGFRLKGGGWYETDFKTQQQKNLVKEDSGISANVDKKNSATEGKIPSVDNNSSIE